MCPGALVCCAGTRPAALSGPSSAEDGHIVEVLALRFLVQTILVLRTFLQALTMFFSDAPPAPRIYDNSGKQGGKFFHSETRGGVPSTR